MKGFFDRLFLPGFAFQYKENSILWDRLLKGKSARIIATMDTPYLYYKYIYGNPGINQLKKVILEFCGIKPVKVTYYAPIRSSTPDQRTEWLEKTETLGLKGV
jgi:NAD(P)H dehydrogenase (quinone)